MSSDQPDPALLPVVEGPDAFCECRRSRVDATWCVWCDRPKRAVIAEPLRDDRLALPTLLALLEQTARINPNRADQFRAIAIALSGQPVAEAPPQDVFPSDELLMARAIHIAHRLKPTHVAADTLFVFDQLTHVRRLASCAPRTPAESEGWQPIESAPKDQTEILVLHRGYVSVVWWDDTCGGWIVAALADQSIYANEATHWRPLPLPPIPAEKAPTR